MTKRIAVFDDSAPFRLLVEQLLSSLNYEVEGFDNPAFYFDQPGMLGHYDLIVMDIHMPGMNGIDALQRIRSHPPTADAQVLIVTGIPAKEAVIKAGKLRVNNFVSKPIDPQDFIDRVIALVGLPEPQ